MIKTTNKHPIKPLNVAFYGGGINSDIGQTHKIALEMDSQFKLVSGCFSRNEDTNLETGAAYGIKENRIYSNLDELIQNEKSRIHAICILTPTPHHYDAVLKCISNCVPVICEKALACSSKEVENIKNECLKQNGFLAIIYNYSGFPMIREMQKQIQAGSIGEISQIHIEMPQESYIKVDQNGSPILPVSWRLNKSPMTMLSLDLGSHVFDLAQYLTQERPLKLVSMQSSHGHFEHLIDNCLILAEYTNNVDANIWFSKSALGYKNGLNVRVFGSKGSFQWTQSTPEVLIYNDNKGQQTILDRGQLNLIEATKKQYNRFKAGHPAGFLEAFANYYFDIASSLDNHIKSSKMFMIGIDSALNGIKMAEGIQVSSKNQAWVTL